MEIKQESTRPTPPAIVTYEYDGNAIHFDKSNQHYMVNLTEMCKPFGKEVKDFLRLESTKAFIEALAKEEDRPVNDLINIKRGRNGGTWAHYLIGIDLAKWLLPAFGVWTAKKTYELLTTGSATLRSTPKELVLPDHVHTFELMGLRYYNLIQVERALGILRKRQRTPSEWRRMERTYTDHLICFKGSWYMTDYGIRTYLHNRRVAMIGYRKPAPLSLFDLPQPMLFTQYN